MAIQVGDKAPDFKTVNQDGKPVALKDFKGKKVILYFYPQDDTETCTIEACNLRDNWSMLKKEGFIVLGVSPDNEKSHQKFIKKHTLPFTLLVDADKKIINAYGLWAEKTMFGRKYMGVLRKTFVIDEKGKIEKIFDKVIAKNHAAQILESYNQ